jgi:hypothetical protein
VDQDDHCPPLAALVSHHHDTVVLFLRNIARALRPVTFYHSFNISQECFKDPNCYRWVVKEDFFVSLKRGACVPMRVV